MDQNMPTGTIIFTTIGRMNYGFDIFSVKVSSTSSIVDSETCLTDGVSINFNGSFVDENQTIVHISERTGSPQIYLTRSDTSEPEPLSLVETSLFHDRPVLKKDRLYFVSAHENPEKTLTSWSAVYSTGLNDGKIIRLTPYGTVDYSPAVSQTGKLIAVASYGSRAWGGEFHELRTDIVVFCESDPSNRTVVCEHGGWPTWCRDSVIYFHRQADDGWWSLFRVELPENFEVSSEIKAPVRVTPSGVHAFTPAAFHDGKRIAVATRRKDSKFRQIEIFDIESNRFYPVTEPINPEFHHYNPFVSPESGFIGYHRFRGKSAPGESTIPHLQQVTSPIKDLRLLRVNGAFPSFSPSGDFIALNLDLNKNCGLKILKSYCSKRWTVLKGVIAFSNSWSPTESNVIYSSIGPIFHSVQTTVQIARISFDTTQLDNDHDEITPEIKILTGEETGNNAFPSCSPDGKSIVFRSGRSGYKNLFVIDAVNGEFDGSIRQITDGPWIDTMPHWSPDGKVIAFSSNRHNPNNPEYFSIYLIEPNGSGLRRVHVAGSEGSNDVDRERINHVCFSKDSEWLLFAANLAGVTAEPVSMPNQFQPYGELFVVRLDGSGLRRLTWGGYEDGTPTWYVGGTGSGADEEFCTKCEVGDKLTGEFVEPLWISTDI